MKVWMFYLVPENPTCEPMLYAFTNRKDRAENFSVIRQNLTKVIKNITKKDYRDMYDKLGDQYAIIEEKLLTRDDDSNVHKVSIYVTSGEAMDFRVHLEKIACAILGISSSDIPIQIFNKDIAKFLMDIGMDSTNKVANSIGNLTPFGFELDDDSLPALWTEDYKLDELYIFLKYKGYTM